MDARPTLRCEEESIRKETERGYGKSGKEGNREEKTRGKRRPERGDGESKRSFSSDD